MIPVFGWLVGLLGATLSAVPFWFMWTYCELGKLYFNFLPIQFHSLPFWDIVGLFLVVNILKYWVLPKFYKPEVPKFFTKKD